MNKKIQNVLKNISKVENIKLEDCSIYNEYSVIVLYKDGSDIIICDDSKEANKLYAYLMKNLNDYQLLRGKTDDEPCK